MKTRQFEKLYEGIVLVDDERIERIRVFATCEKRAKLNVIENFEKFKEFKYFDHFDFIKVVEC